MAEILLEIVDDPIDHYRGTHDGVAAIRIERGIALSGVERLVFRDRTWILREDHLAEKSSQKASILSRALEAVRFNRSFSLHDAEGALVLRARRQWNFSMKKDRVALFDRDDREVLVAHSVSTFGSRRSLTHAGAPVGDAVFSLLGGEVRVVLHALDDLHGILMAYALHRVFGQNPHDATGAA